MQRPVLDLDPVQETLLIPLYGRATLTRQGSPLIDDPRAVAMVESIDYDWAKLDGLPSLFGATLRTRIFDHWVSAWLERNPDGTVVEIGAGLNTRYERLDNGRARWFELDLPGAMALRRRFFADDERRTLLTGSVTDGAWVEAVAPTGGPWFVVAEAVLPFLPGEDVRTALAHMTRFRRSRIALDTWGSWMAEHQDEHDALSRMDARVAWCIDDPATLREWEPDLRLTDSCILPDAPAPVRDLLPPEVIGALPAMRADPQVASYRLNLFTTAG